MTEERISGFFLYKSNRLEVLLPEVFILLDKISEHNPLLKKNIVVQSEETGRWLALKAASHKGVLANFSFVTPDGFLRNFAGEHFGIDTKNSVFYKKSTEWALYSLFKSGTLEKNGFERIKNYIGDDDGRNFSFCRRMADMFEQYSVYRPRMMKSWAEGRNYSADEDEGWQRALFEELCKVASSESAGFASVFNAACDAAKPSDSYPPALILFGISVMNKYQLDMFRHLSQLFPIYIFSMFPCAEYLYAASGKTGGFEDVPPDETPDTFFGRFCAASLDFTDFTAAYQIAGRDFFDEPGGNSLLASLQRDILHDSAEPEPADFDGSIIINVCRDKMREIEVLKDSLLGLFNADPALKPEDVVVMTPKIKDYLPYVSAVFGSVQPQDETYIPWSVSDMSFAEEGGVVSAFLETIRLMKSDFGRSQVLSVLKNPYVCQKFGIGGKDLLEIEKLVSESGVKWGIDAASRGESGESGNTWDFGLSRIAMSFVMPFSAEGRSFGNILPLENLSGDKSGIIEGFFSFVSGIFCFYNDLQGEKTPAEFKRVLCAMLDFLFVDDDPASEGLLYIRRILGDFAETAGKYAGKVSFDALSVWLEDELGKGKREKVFSSAKVNFCSLKPLRTLPFKVVCLVGMDEDSFPRSDRSLSFDLTRRIKAEPGEPANRSVRDNDLYLFLESIVSARDKLIISYEANDLSDESGKRRKAALPLAVLEKYIEKKTGKKVEEMETKYPVQPFSAAYFAENSAFRTFSKRDYEIARTMFHVKQRRHDPLPERVSEETGKISGSRADITLDSLVSFFKNPSKYYFKEVPKLVLNSVPEDDCDDEIFDYDGEYLLKSGLCRIYLEIAEKVPPEEVLRSFISRIKGEGKIPWGVQGEKRLEALVEEYCLPRLAERLRAEKQPDPDFVDYSVDLEDLKFTGRMERSRSGGITLIFPSKWKIRDGIEALIRHYAANAASLHAETRIYALQKKRKPGGFEITEKVLKPLDAATAGKKLAVFAELMELARNKMPLYDPAVIDFIRIKNVRPVSRELLSDAVENYVNGMFKNGYFMLAAEQFAKRKDFYYSEFPGEKIIKIIDFLGEIE